MKKIIPFIASSFLSVLFFSCSKEKNENPGNNPNPASSLSRIKTWSNSTSQSTYLYNNAAKLIEVQSNSGSKEVFEYPTGKLVKKQYNTAGLNDFTAEFELNSEGLCITEKRPSHPNFTATLIYNEQKQIVKKIYSNNGLIQALDYFFSNGNCDSIRMTENNTWKYTRHFTYYTDKLNHLSSEAYGYPFFGKDNKNLLKSDQFVQPDGSKSELVTTTYEFDEKGRPVKEIQTKGINIFINFITYY